jgi:hypothetical protein
MLLRTIKLIALPLNTYLKFLNLKDGNNRILIFKCLRYISSKDEHEYPNDSDNHSLKNIYYSKQILGEGHHRLGALTTGKRINLFCLEVVIEIGAKWCPSIPPKNACLLGTKGGS